jgi:hypothetical protein
MTPDEARRLTKGLTQALGFLRKATPRTREISIAIAAIERSLVHMRILQRPDP